MDYDLTLSLIQATVQLDQPLADGGRTVGTGFLVAAQDPDGRPRIVLVTAGHVLDRMPAAGASIGYRRQGPDGVWRYAPETLRIRDEGGKPLWTRHPDQDVAALSLTAPEAFARAAIPLAWLADEETFDRLQVGAGDEMLALGFPRGLSSNTAGFPILRSGRVASYPVTPARAYPTFLMDFNVFPGNSGGPVFMSADSRRRTGAAQAPPAQFVAGMLTQQVELNKERLDIGIVIHALFIRETLNLLDPPMPPPSP